MVAVKALGPALAVAALLAGCAGPLPRLGDLPLAGPLWTVESIMAGDVGIAAHGAGAHIQVTADGHLDVATGCNAGRGSVRVDRDWLILGEISLTRRACEGFAAGVESGVLAALNRGPVRYRIDGSTLFLEGGDRRIVLRGG